jgi:hypothetical protein
MKSSLNTHNMRNIHKNGATNIYIIVHNAVNNKDQIIYKEARILQLVHLNQ